MKPVTVYTTSYCVYCSRAKSLLSKLGIPYQEVDVEGDDKKRAWLVETTGQRTVPQIFIGDEPIGGYTDLAALNSRGQLQAKLA